MSKEDSDIIEISSTTITIITVLIVLACGLGYYAYTQSQNQLIKSSQELKSNGVEPLRQTEYELAKPYLDKIVTNDISLRGLSSSIISVCGSDVNCKINKVYNYIVDNFNYISDPRNEEFIQTPTETLAINGGDCEDLSILLNSLLENIGIKTYLVLTDNHAYSLACGIETEAFTESVGKYSLSLVSEKDQSFVLEYGNTYYYGGTNPESKKAMSLGYSVSSSEPLDIYFVPNKEDFDLMSEGKEFNHYSSCQKKSVLSVTDICEGMDQSGGIILQNTNYNSARVSMVLKWYQSFASEIKYYQSGDKFCVVLDATAGEYGYPGYDANVIGIKTAFDSVTHEQINLK